MFPQKLSEQQKTQPSKIEKQFMGIDHSIKYMWWKEEISYLFIPVTQITEVKIVPATDSSFNVYARLDLKDRFEYKLIDNKKTLAAAKKLAEDFVKLIYQNSEPEKITKTEETETVILENYNAIEALKNLDLKEELKSLNKKTI